MLDYNHSLTAVTLLLSILIFWRSLVFRKRCTSQADLLRSQTEQFAEIQEIEKSQLLSETFETNLQQAEVTTKLQKPRSAYLQNGQRVRPPERYQYAKTMHQSGMQNDEISYALGMSDNEISQVLKLAKLCSSRKISDNLATGAVPA